MNTPNLPPEDGAPADAEPPPDDVLAGEFVLGVLEAAQHRQLQARADTDPAFAQRVAGWEACLAPLLADIEPVEVPATVWTGICQRLGWRSSDSERAGFWRSLVFWRFATAVSAVVAVAAITWTVQRTPAPLSPVPLLVRQPSPPEAAARPVTALNHDNGTPGWLASVDPARGTVLMVPVPAAPDAQGRVPELWLIPAGKAPRSLGVVSTSQSHMVTVPPDARAALVAGSVLAISLEPPTGVPHAAPTGPIIAKGAIQIQASAS